MEPGYLFLAPYRNRDEGLHIYDNYGNLVYSHPGEAGPKITHAPRVCTYQGRDHLCWFEGDQHQGFARGHGIIMDQNYRVVKEVHSQGAGVSNDMHEFKMTPYSNGTTVLMTAYQPRQYDVMTNPRFNLENGLGWIVEGVFQEVDIETNRLIFEWRSLDHVDPGLSWTMPSSTDTSGDGLHEETPWDYFHINSVDKNVEGDYLISARHVSAIYKVSGVDGHIIWQLGGNAATLSNTNFQFSYQHHARWMSENATHTVLSFFDNGSNLYNSTSDFSHGFIVEIDHVTGDATKVKEWGAPEPEGGLKAGSQGSFQLLPGGNALLGWGEYAWFSEHTADGSAVMYGKMADYVSGVHIYRAYKQNWTGTPDTSPALWTYSKEGEEMAFYVSWNGATDVRGWNFYTSDKREGPYEFVGSSKKNGFETEVHVPGARNWSYAEALDKNDRPMRASVVARTFRPSEQLKPFCSDRGCDYAKKVDDEHRVEYEEVVEVDQKYLSTNRGFNTSNYYIDRDEIEHDDDYYYSGAQDSSPSSGIGRDIFLMAIGGTIGFGLMTFGIILNTCGVFRPLEPLADKIGRRSSEFKDVFGSKVLGKYTRVETKEMETLDSASSSSSRLFGREARSSFDLDHSA